MKTLAGRLLSRPDWLLSQAKVDFWHSRNSFSVHSLQGKIMQGEKMKTYFILSSKLLDKVTNVQ